jgi:hypothetical protein
MVGVMVTVSITGPGCGGQGVAFTSVQAIGNGGVGFAKVKLVNVLKNNVLESKTAVNLEIFISTPLIENVYARDWHLINV